MLFGLIFKVQNSDANCQEKKLVFWRESRSVGISLISVNKSIKETENLIFYQIVI